MSKDDCRRQMLELLEAQIKSIGAANDYLLNIKNAIAANKLDNLDPLLDNPELPIEDILEIEQQRFGLLQNFGFESDSTGFEMCVTWCDNSKHELTEAHQQLTNGLTQLQHSIQLNNLLIGKGKDRVRRSIGILTGQGSTMQSKTYSNKGQTLESASQRNIAIA